MGVCLICGDHAALSAQALVYVCAGVAVLALLAGAAWWAWEASRGWRTRE